MTIFAKLSIYMRNLSYILILTLLGWLNAWAVEDSTSVDSCARFEILGQYLYDVGNINNYLTEKELKSGKEETL